MALCLSLVGCTSTAPLVKEGDTVIYAQDGSTVITTQECRAEDDTAELGIAAAILAAMMLL